MVNEHSMMTRSQTKLPQSNKDKEPSCNDKNSSEMDVIRRSALNTYLKTKRVQILKAVSSDLNLENLEPGNIYIDNKRIYVGTKDASIQVKELQLEGKRIMDDSSFINGYLRNSEKTFKFENR